MAPRRGARGARKPQQPQQSQQSQQTHQPQQSQQPQQPQQPQQTQQPPQGSRYAASTQGRERALTGTEQGIAAQFQHFPNNQTYQAKRRYDFNGDPKFVLEVGMKGKVVNSITKGNPPQPFYQIEVSSPDSTPEKPVIAFVPKTHVTIWPEGFPFECVRDYHVTRPGVLHLDKGQRGQIIRLKWDVDREGKSLKGRPDVLPWFQVSCNGKQGFVQWWALNIGRVNAAGVVTIAAGFPQRLNAPLNSSDIAPGGVFDQTLSALIVAFANAPSSIIVPRNIARLIDTDEKRKNVYSKLYAGVQKAGIVNLLNSTFTCSELATKGQRIGTSPHKSGIYIILYADFSGKFKGDLAKVYTGKSVDMKSRMSQHQISSTKFVDWTYHYEPRRESSKRAEVAICFLDSDESDMMSLAEQIFTTLFNSFHHTMIDFQAELATNPEESALVKRFADKEQATLLWLYATSVFEKTKWSNYVGSKTFQASDGLNRTIPMSEVIGTHDKTIWVQSTVQNKMSVFRRAACVALAQVYPAWEISENGPHPVPWARLPELAPISDWADARRVALRIDWQEGSDQKWRRLYIQAGNLMPARFFPNSGSAPMDLESMNHPPIGANPVPDLDKLLGARSTYVYAIGVFRWLKHLRVSNDYTWMPNFGVARIKQSSMNYLNSQIVIESKGEEGQPIPRATPVPWINMVQQLRDAQAGFVMTFRPQGIDGTVPGVPAGYRRSTCDSCYAVGGSVRLACRRPAFNPHSQTCGNCAQKAIPCSWTYFEAGSRLDRLCGVVPLQNQAVLEPGEPQAMEFFEG
ncbi:hypothetical protein LTR10_019477 [Elasticomyces elasticus]|nr:hypothetical protein LTR10_019477 [Elasticomyces elasticus]